MARSLSIRLLAGSLIAALLLAGCDTGPESGDDVPLVVATTSIMGDIASNVVGDEGNVEVLIQPLGMTAGDKADLIAFMTNELTDPRVPGEAGPLFDRPLLYAESARVPTLAGSARPGGSIRLLA